MKKNSIKLLIVFFVLMSLSGCVNKKLLECRNVALKYYDNNDYHEALNYFNEALKMGDGAVGKVQFDLLLYKAECLFMLEKYSEAREVYDVLMKVDKRNKSYNELYDNINVIVGFMSLREALDSDDVEKATEIVNYLKENGYEHEKSVIYNQAVLYEKKGEWKDALNSFNYYLKQYPNDENAMHEIEFINAQLNNAD